jgi:hypothetical protein
MGSKKFPPPDAKLIKSIDRDTMRQAIATAFHGPTDHRGSRIIARCEAGSLTWECDDALHVRENHIAAALALAGKLGWLDHCDMVGGGVRGGGYAFVLVAKSKPRKV